MTQYRNMLDIHTHTKHNPLSLSPSIYNLSCSEDLEVRSEECFYPHPCSVGLHPWHISPEWEERMRRVEQLAAADNVILIGETGLDKIKSSVPLALQEEIFLRHVQLSERFSKPLIIHCVKAYDELIRLRRTLRPTQPWIIHGFRGKPQQAAQLLQTGFQLSFGEHFHPDSLRLAVERQSAWLETDESTLSIEEIHKKATESIGIKSFLLPLPNLLEKTMSK